MVTLELFFALVFAAVLSGVLLSAAFWIGWTFVFLLMSVRHV